MPQQARPYEQITADKAREQLLAGVSLENCQIPYLDLGSDTQCLVYEKPVIIRRCMISGLVLSGAKFLSEIRMEGSVIEGGLLVGAMREDQSSPVSPEKRGPAVLESHLLMLGSGIQGDFDLVRCSGKSLSLTRVTVDGQIRAMGMSLSGKWEANQVLLRKNIDLRGARCIGGLSLEKSKLEGSLLFTSGKSPGGIKLSNMEIAGNVDLSETVGPEGNLAISNSTVGGDFALRQSAWKEAKFHDVKIKGHNNCHSIRLEKGGFWDKTTAKSLEFQFARSLKLTVRSCQVEKFSLTNGNIAESVEISQSSADIAHFPQLTAMSLDIQRCKLGRDVDLRKAKVTNCIWLKECDVTGPVEMGKLQTNKLSLRKSIFHNAVTLDWAIIAGKLDFGSTQVEGALSLSRLEANGIAIFFNGKFKDIDMTEADFDGEVFFLRPEAWKVSDDVLNEYHEGGCKPAHIQGTLNMRSTQFKEFVYLENLQVTGQVLAKGAKVDGDLILKGAQIQGSLDLTQLQALSNVDLGNAKIQGELQLDDSDIRRRLNLSGCEFATISFANALVDHFVVSLEQVRARMRESKTPEAMLQQRSEFLILRQAFEEMGHHDAQDWAHWRCRRMERKAHSAKAFQDLRRGPSLADRLSGVAALARNLFIRICIDAGSGYGTQPARVALLALAIILSFAGLYFVNSSQMIFGDLPRTQSPSFLLSLYFSAVTFTTMGIGNVYPSSDGWLKYPVACEALLGIVVMTLFVGTWTRKIVR